MYYIKFLILTKSSKNKQYCVAGIDLQSQKWVRLVSRDIVTDGAISEDDMRTEDGYSCKPLDVVNVPIDKSAPSSCQTENLIIAKYKWEYLYSMTIDEAITVLPFTKTEFLFHNSEKCLPAKIASQLTSSLLVARVSNLKIYRNVNNSMKCRFVYGNDLYDEMSMTDPDFYISFNENSCFSISKAIIVMSLPHEAFEKEGKDLFYKFVAKIYHQSRVRKYDHSGFDQFGFNMQGLHRNGTKFDSDGYDVDGYNRCGFNIDGIHKNGTPYNRDGYDREGFDCEGYDRDGYDREGFDREGYNRDGYDREGFDINGYDARGFDRSGIFKKGGIYDSLGYDVTGFNREGFDIFGMHRNGTKYDDEGYDAYGYNSLGVNRQGCYSNGYNAHRDANPEMLINCKVSYRGKKGIIEKAYMSGRYCNIDIRFEDGSSLKRIDVEFWIYRKILKVLS